jgi:glycosyltransferase involved in cell wall biosynthesis
LKPRALFLVPADYDALRRKGVDRMILERDEAGFFERVVTVHPLALHDRTIDLTAVHCIHEFSVGRALRGQSGFVARLAAPLRLMRLMAHVARIARAERVDMVRANDPYLMGLFAWWVSRVAGVPFCVSLHADYAKRFQLTPKGWWGHTLRRVASVIPRFVLPRAALVLPIREHMVPWLEASGSRPGTIRVIPHGIDMAPFTDAQRVDTRAVFDIPPGAPIVSFVGRLTPDNYARDMADIVERVARSRPAVVFVLLGEGPEEPYLRQRFGAFSRAVRLLPFQSYEQVVALRRTSMVSLCLMGGFSLIEACAARSAVIAYDVEWHRELVQDGITGYLVREHDVAGVAAAIERLVDDPAAAAAMGEAARSVAFARHDRNVTSRIKRELYAELLERRELAAS